MLFFDQFEGSARGAQALPFKLIKNRGNIFIVKCSREDVWLSLLSFLSFYFIKE